MHTDVSIYLFFCLYNYLCILMTDVILIVFYFAWEIKINSATLTTLVSFEFAIF